MDAAVIAEDPPAVTKVKCRDCGAMPGQSCLTPRGVPTVPHAIRWRLADGELEPDRIEQIEQSVAMHAGSPRLVTTVMAECGASYDEVARAGGWAS